ncbi:MAG: hypothetical protein ACO3JL_11205 [Myxococcota bacterium]
MKRSVRVELFGTCLTGALLCLACTTLRTGVAFTPHADAPELTTRPDGCYVEVLELGREPRRRYLAVGTLQLRVSDEDLRFPAVSVADRFRKAGCEYGVFLVKDIKAFPDPGRGVVEYSATAALWLDDQGIPIVVPTGAAQ